MRRPISPEFLLLVAAGVILIAAAAPLARGTDKVNRRLAAKSPTRPLGYILVGVGFIVVGLAAFLGWA